VENEKDREAELMRGVDRNGAPPSEMDEERKLGTMFGTPTHEGIYGGERIDEQ
jgi:hypothetical protein